MITLGVLSAAMGSGAGFDMGVLGSASSDPSSVDAFLEYLARILRPARRSNLSFGAPVA